MWRYLSALKLYVSIVVLIGLSPGGSDAASGIATATDTVIEFDWDELMPSDRLSVAAHRIDGTISRSTDRLADSLHSDHMDREIDPPTFGSIQIQDMVLLVGHRVSVSLPEATGGAGTVSYSLSGSLPPGIDFEAATRLLSGTPTAATGRTTYTYVATDNNNATAQLTFTIRVQASGIPAFPPGSSIDDLVFVVDKQLAYPALPAAIGGDGTLTYTLNPSLPGGLTFNSTTRIISGAASSILSPIPYAFSATDSNGDQTPNPLLFTIAVEFDTQPTFAGNPISDYTFTAGEEIDAISFPVAYGGNGNLTYAMTGLPSGLKFDPVTRELTGTPDAETASATVAYTVSDFDGDKISATFTITVLPGVGTPLAFDSSIGDRTYVVNQAIPVLQLPQATGGQGTIAYNLTPSLPVGLTFSAVDRTISGTPGGVVNATEYEYVAIDEANATDTLTFSITVLSRASSVPRFGTATVEDLVFLEGQTISTMVLPRAVGGIGRILYSIAPDLPSGLVFNSQNRQLTGTPVAESAYTNYSYTAHDDAGSYARLSFAIEVVADIAPTFQSESITDIEFVEGQSGRQVTLPEASGGNGTITYSISPDLPDGLTFESKTRRLGGTPKAPSSAEQFNYIATDMQGDADTLMFMLSVAQWTQIRVLNSLVSRTFDVYVGDVRLLEDLGQGSRPASVLAAGQGKVDFVASTAATNEQPLLTVPVELAGHHHYDVMVYDDGSQLQVATAEYSELPEPISGQVAVYVAHGAPDLGAVSVRVLDARDNTTVIYDLASGVPMGGFSGFVSIGAAGHNVEVSSTADGSQLAVYRFNLDGQRNKVIALMLSSDNSMVGVTPQGRLIRPGVITSTGGSDEIPDEPLALDGNYPNPFNPVTRIQFHLGEPAQVRVHVMDLLGRRVLEIPEQSFRAGYHLGIDVPMGQLASGLYLYRIRASMESGIHYETGRMTLAK